MAPEKRLIDANVLWKALDKAHLFDDGNPRHIAQQTVEEQPTVDAVEVVHGSMRHVFYSYQDNHFQCTCCNGNFITNAARYWNYCPNCGAKMDGITDKC